MQSPARAPAAAPTHVTIQRAITQLETVMVPTTFMVPQVATAPVAAAPSCPTSDLANAQLMSALIQASNQQNAPAASLSDEEAELESRARKLEDRLDRLTKALEGGQ